MAMGPLWRPSGNPLGPHSGHSPPGMGPLALGPQGPPGLWAPSVAKFILGPGVYYLWLRHWRHHWSCPQHQWRRHHWSCPQPHVAGIDSHDYFYFAWTPFPPDDNWVDKGDGPGWGTCPVGPQRVGKDFRDGQTRVVSIDDMATQALTGQQQRNMF